jgi:group I intron endonuclease
MKREILSGIYKISNSITGDAYIGSSKDIYKRWSSHKNGLYKNKHINIILQRAWNKYGSENFNFEIIEKCEPNFLLEKEQFYLNDKPIYNIGKNSSGGDNLSNNPNRDEIISKIKKSIRYKYDNMSDDEKIKLYKNRKGDENSNYGNIWSDEMRKEASIRVTEYFKTHDNYKLGKTHKECFGEEKAKEISKKMSEFASTKIGEKNSFFGKSHSDETKKILKEKRTGKYNGSQNIPFFIDDIEYTSLGDAAKKLNISITTIRWRLKSKNNKFKNYHY